MNEDKQTEEQEPQNKQSKPDDYSSMYIRNFLKITDPESGEVILETAT